MLMKRVLVTGANGFVGKNLCLRLGMMDDIEIVKYDIDDSFSLIEDTIRTVDFVFHLAGVNRPDSVEGFYSGNTDFTKALVSLIRDCGVKPGFVFSSSIQAELDNDYGKSKKIAEDAVLDMKDITDVFVYRLHNVFGKWCRPNYNSVVATFCNNIMRGLPIAINDPNRVMELVYIDDIIDEFVHLVNGFPPKNRAGDYCYIKPKYEITLGDLSKKIMGFKSDLNGIEVPETGDDFTKKFFSTFVSYAKSDDIIFEPNVHSDQRGRFIELLRTESAGQVSVSVSKPGIVRGNHFHDTKMEKFIVLSGEARISFRHMATGDMMTFNVSGESPEIVTIPVGYTHNIENCGERDMVLLIWANEKFDSDKPDTYFAEV
jgi:UDP-2-acetamido-2,6-beta-L-arabino-hexul-4-ose reductase